MKITVFFVIIFYFSNLSAEIVSLHDDLDHYDILKCNIFQFNSCDKTWCAIHAKPEVSAKWILAADEFLSNHCPNNKIHDVLNRRLKVTRMELQRALIGEKYILSIEAIIHQNGKLEEIFMKKYHDGELSKDDPKGDYELRAIDGDGIILTTLRYNPEFDFKAKHAWNRLNLKITQSAKVVQSLYKGLIVEEYSLKSVKTPPHPTPSPYYTTFTDAISFSLELDENLNILKSGIDKIYQQSLMLSFEKNSYTVRSVDTNNRVISFIYFTPERDLIKKNINGKWHSYGTFRLGVNESVQEIQLLKGSEILSRSNYIKTSQNTSRIPRRTLPITASPEVKEK